MGIENYFEVRVSEGSSYRELTVLSLMFQMYIELTLTVGNSCQPNVHILKQLTDHNYNISDV